MGRGDVWIVCEYIDYAVSWIKEEDWPKKWTCAECGGTHFMGVHRDYQRSGFAGTAFTVEPAE
jgi:hypothetical protein